MSGRGSAVYPGLSAELEQEITPDTSVEALRKLAERHGVEFEPGWDAEKLVMRAVRRAGRVRR